MILNEKGKGIIKNDTEYIIGECVCANETTEYKGLVGPIIEIRTGTDKDTDNNTEDIYVDFKGDIVVMAPDMIIPIKNLF